jgi:S-methylmethionine-dependent homocysteine/selenocysteine methylase
MPRYRSSLPQLGDKLFVTDAGLETVLMFHDKRDLPGMAAFILLRDSDGTERLRQYYRDFAQLAREFEVGLVLESPTWRAHADLAEVVGVTPGDIDEANRKAIDLLLEVRREFEAEQSPMVISGNIGPRGDGYSPSKLMTPDQAQEYHSRQMNIFRDSEADMVSAFTLNYVEEALGVTRAAKEARMPFVIAFTVETDGRLPKGQSLKDAIEAVDADSGNYPAYYMINCAHPTHFDGVLDTTEPWVQRLGGMRANSSCKSHAELDESEFLDEGNPAELGRQNAALVAKIPHLRVLGGCCGTDIRHVRAILQEVTAPA